MAELQQKPIGQFSTDQREKQKMPAILSGGLCYRE